MRHYECGVGGTLGGQRVVLVGGVGESRRLENALAKLLWCEELLTTKKFV
jgi:hypothetical protein